MPLHRRRLMAAALAPVPLAPMAAAAAGEDAIERGAYLTRAGGCFSCHTAPGGQPLAGGRALATPFGTFYSPNITPDPEAGIGRWTDAQFLRALREGVRPDRANYFPVFPYPSFTGVSDSDALAIKAHLFSVIGTPKQPATSGGFPVLLAVTANRVEMVVLYTGAILARPRAWHRL